MVELLKLYGMRERAIKRARELEALLNIRKERDVELEFNILVRKIHKLDNEIFEAERKLQRKGKWWRYVYKFWPSYSKA